MLKVEKLNEEFLGDVTGGNKVVCGIAVGTVGAVCLTMLTGLLIEMAGCIYNSKAIRACNHGNVDDCTKYQEKSDRLDKIGGDIATLGISAALRHYENS